MKYRALVGLDYPPGRRAEPGDVIDDLPKESVEHELAAGHIEPVQAPAKTGKGGE